MKQGMDGISCQFLCLLSGSHPIRWGNYYPTEKTKKDAVFSSLGWKRKLEPTINTHAGSLYLFLAEPMASSQWAPAALPLGLWNTLFWGCIADHWELAEEPVPKTPLRVEAWAPAM